LAITGPEVARKADAELARHDLRQRGLAEAGRTDEQHMVERLVARLRAASMKIEIGARLLLADEFGQPLRAQRGVAASSSRRSGVTMRGWSCGHFASSFSPSRMSCAVSAQASPARDQLRGLALAMAAAACGWP
jgi:hypothetical protein